MASSQNGNLGLWSGYTPGDNGWTSQHNTNWDALDTLPQLTIKDNATTTPPGSPANGDAYIVPSGATGAWASNTNKIAVWFSRNSAWTMFSPRVGWSGYVQSKNAEYVWTGTAWAPMNRGQQTFTSNGTFTVPSNVSTIYVSAVAGGGGGGGSGSANSGVAGGAGGGGAGQFVIKQAYTVTPGGTISITIGSGGTSGAAAGSGGGAGGDGGAGGNTVVGSLVTLSGGGGGSHGNGTSGFGAGGPGGAGNPNGCYGADGQAGAFGGAGAGCPYGEGGFGGRGAQGAPIAGNNAAGFGCGGGGAGGVYVSNTQAGSAGGTGSPGLVIIEW